MLKEIFQAFTGAATTTAYTNPASFGIQGVSPQASFKNFFNTFTSSLSNNPQGGLVGGMPQMPMGNGAVQAYRNIQFGGPTQGSPFIGSRHKSVRAQAFAPGAAVFDAGFNQGQMPQLPPTFSQTLSQGLVAPNQLAGLNPLQGGTYQNNPTNSFGQGSSIGQGAAGAMPYLGNGLGKIQMLLFPIIGLFSMVRSLFGMRKIISSMKPEMVSRDNLSFNHSQQAYQDYENTDGYFDDYDPEIIENEPFDIRKMQDF